MNVLMIGAAGNYAGLVVPELTKRGVTVRALVRNEDEAIVARQRGALSQTLEADEPSVDEWAQSSNIPAGPLSEGLAAVNADYDQYGFPGGNGLVLRAILGRKPRTLAAYIHKLASK